MVWNRGHNAAKGGGSAGQGWLQRAQHSCSCSLAHGMPRLPLKAPTCTVLPKPCGEGGEEGGQEGFVSTACLHA